MLTKNFYNFVMAYVSRCTIADGYRDISGDVKKAAPSSATQYMFDYMKVLTLTTSTNTGSSSTKGNGVRIGTGVTPATKDDYQLENQITSGISIVNPSGITAKMEDGYVEVSATYTVTNTGTTAIAVSEIGLFGDAMSGNYTLIMYDRTVLESPIVLNPNQPKTLTYTIRFNYPNE